MPSHQWRMHLDLSADKGDGAILWDGNAPWADDIADWTIPRDLLIDNEPIAPVTPTGLRVTNVSATEVDLAWIDNAYNETGNRIERRLGSSADFEPLAQFTGAATDYSD